MLPIPSHQTPNPLLPADAPSACMHVSSARLSSLPERAMGHNGVPSTEVEQIFLISSQNYVFYGKRPKYQGVLFLGRWCSIINGEFPQTLHTNIGISLAPCLCLALFFSCILLTFYTRPGIQGLEFCWGEYAIHSPGTCFGNKTWISRVSRVSGISSA